MEYIVVDGQSTDGTLEILARIDRRLREREYPIHCNGIDLHLFSGKDEGMYDALCRGFRNVTGDVVAYINSDDFYLPNAFSTVSDIFSSFGDVDWMTGMPTCFNEKGQIIETYLPLAYRPGWIRRGLYGTALHYIQQESTFFRANVLGRIDMEKLKTFRYAGDYFIWHSLSAHYDLFIVESCLGGFRKHKGQLSGNLERYRKEFLEIADRRELFDGLGVFLYFRLNRYLSNSGKRRWNDRILHYRDGHWVKGAGP